MSFRSNIEMTGSKWLGFIIILVGAALSFYLKDGTTFIAACTAGAGLYVNKQYQDRMKTKYENEKIQTD